MTRQKFIALTLPLIFALAAPLVVVPGKGRKYKAQTQAQRRTFDESRFPIADYLAAKPTDPNERAKRQAGGKKYDNSSWRVHPEDVSDSTVRVDHVDRTLAALPLEISSVVVLGQITDAQAYLSNDKTGVYSVFTMRVDEVLKNS